MAGLKYRPKKGEGRTKEGLSFVPTALRADHRRNASRAPLYSVPEELKAFVGEDKPLAADVFCFTLAEVEARLDSLKVEGQITDVTIYMTAVMAAHVTEGYLRHAAFLLAVARGELESIPTGAMVGCKRVAQPKSPGDWLVLAQRNFAENAESKELTPVDRAYYARRLHTAEGEGGYGLPKDQIADKLGISARAVDRYLALLALHPDVIRAVHTGETSMSKALASASKKGEGNANGPRAGVKMSAVKRALAHASTRVPPASMLTETSVPQLLAILAGTETLDESTPGAVRAWVEWADAPKDAARASNKKLAPKKAGSK